MDGPGRRWRPRRVFDIAQARRAIRIAHREQLSAHRLATVWAEREAEIATRLGEDIMVEYRFKCKFCQSRFSLAQQCEAHEKDCATAEERAAAAAEPERGAEEMTEGVAVEKVLHCRRCGVGFPSLKELAAHVRTEHAAEFRQAASAGTRRRYEETRKIDQAIAAKQPPAPAGPSAATPRAPAVHGPLPHRPAAAVAAPPGPSPGPAACCPTCGGPLPVLVANLVGALTRAGFAELQAFEAARIMRQVTRAAA